MGALENLDCRLLRSMDEIDAIEGEWDRLWHAQRIRHVFQGFGWHRAILDAHTERQPCVVTARDRERLVGLLPLAEDGDRLSFLGAPYSDYCDLLADVPDPGRLLEEMLEALGQDELHTLTLDNVRKDAVLSRATEEAGSMVKERLLWQPGQVCPTTLLDNGDSDTYAAILRKKSLRRHENKLARQGNLRFEHIVDEDRARSLLPVFFQQHVERRERAGDESLFLRQEARDFYQALIARLGLEIVRFAVLRLDGSPVAFHFGFEYDHRFTWYKPSFDVAWSSYSPGEVLLKRLFEYARLRKLEEFDFTRGQEEFKTRFANASQQNRTLLVFSPGPRGQIEALALRAKQQLKGVGWLRRSSRWIRDASH